MNATIRARFRHAILEQLAAANDMGLPISTIRNGCNYSGVTVSEDEVEAECEGYLSNEGFITNQTTAPQIHAGVSRYRITAAGRGYLAAQGLA